MRLWTWLILALAAEGIRSQGVRHTQEGSMNKLLVFVLVSVVALTGLASQAAAQTTLRVVMHSDLKIVDPIWTTAYISRNHGYMIYDTLFAMDAQGEIRPQMVDKYEVSPDQLTYTLTLRDRKSTRLNSSHLGISYAVFCLKKKNQT